MHKIKLSVVESVNKSGSAVVKAFIKSGAITRDTKLTVKVNNWRSIFLNQDFVIKKDGVDITNADSSLGMIEIIIPNSGHTFYIDNDKQLDFY